LEDNDYFKNEDLCNRYNSHPNKTSIAKVYFGVGHSKKILSKHFRGIQAPLKCKVEGRVTKFSIPKVMFERYFNIKGKLLEGKIKMNSNFTKTIGSFEILTNFGALYCDKGKKFFE
jgi:hypothetical protein